MDSATAELMRGRPIGAVLGSADAKEPGEIAFAVGVIALGARWPWPLASLPVTR